MSTAERTFITVFGLATVSAILATPFLGIWPVAAVVVGIMCMGAAGSVLNARNARQRDHYESYQRNNGTSRPPQE